MIHRSADSNGFEFVRVASLRAAQLMRGCSPRVAPSHKSILTAQMEVVAGKVIADVRVNGEPAPPPLNHRKHQPNDYVRVNNR